MKSSSAPSNGKMRGKSWYSTSMSIPRCGSFAIRNLDDVVSMLTVRNLD